MSEQDVRWVQRFEHYQKALAHLGRAVELATERDLSDLEKEGVIKVFEYTFGLAWNTLKDILEHQGHQILGPRDAIEKAFDRGLIKNGEVWIAIMKSRNLTSHAYNQETVDKIFNDVVANYYDAFEKLKTVLLDEKKKNETIKKCLV